MDILLRAQARVVKFSQNGASDNVVEVTASDFNELLVEIVRLRAKLEEIAERSTVFSSIGQLQKMARDGILPE